MRVGDHVPFVRTGGANPIVATVAAVNADGTADLVVLETVRGVQILDEAPADSRAALYCTPAVKPAG